MSHVPQDEKKPLSRRAFIKNAAGVAAGAAVASGIGKQARADVYKSILPASVLGANEKILTGHIGTGGMGRSNLGFVLQRDDMQPIAVCDLYDRNLKRGEQMVKQKFENVATYHDFRELLEMKDIDLSLIHISEPTRPY